MRKDCDGGKKREKNGEKKEKTDENSGHYVIASSRPPERRPLERRTLAPIKRLCLVNSTIDGNGPSQKWTRLTYLDAKLKISESNVPLFLPKMASFGF